MVKVAEPEAKDSLITEHRTIAASPVEKACAAIDHLVDALAGEPSSPLHRVAALIDIARYPGTTQTAMMDRLSMDKSSANRNIDWLYNYGCITRATSVSSGRETALTVCSFSYNHLIYAAKSMDKSHGGDLTRLQSLVEGYITFFQGFRATLRDARIVTTLSAQENITRQGVFDKLYNGPLTTDIRALVTLIEQGFVTSDDEETKPASKT
jgi:hypothetical protein